MIHDICPAGNPSATTSDESAKDLGPQSRQGRGVTLAQFGAGLDRLRSAVADLAATETPPADPSMRECWERLRAKREQEQARERDRQERERQRAAAAAAGRIRPATHDQVLARARAYLRRMEPPVSGQNGGRQTMRGAAALVRGFALTPDDAYPLLYEWSLGSPADDRWSEYDLRRKLEHADANTDEPRGGLLEDYRPPVASAPARMPGEPTPAEIDAILAAEAASDEPTPFEPHFDVWEHCPKTTCVHKVGRQGTDAAGKHRWQVHRCDEYRCGPCNPRRAQRDYQHLANLVGAFERDTDPQKGTLALGLVEPGKRATVQRDLNRKCCRYARILTTATIDRFDAPSEADVRSMPMGDAPRTPDTTASDIGKDQTRPPRVLVVAHVPATSKMPVGFVSVDPSEALRAGGMALMCVPTETDAKRYEPVTFSREWARPKEPKSNYAPVNKSEYTAAEAATAAQRCGLDVKTKRSRSPRVQGRYTEVSGPPILTWVFGRLMDTSEPTKLTQDVPTAFRRLRPALRPTMRPGPATRHVLEPVLWSGPQPDTHERLDLATELDAQARSGVREWVLARLLNTEGLDFGEAADRFREWLPHLPHDVEASCLVRDMVGPRLLDGPTATTREEITRRRELEVEADAITAGLREEGCRSGNYHRWLKAQPEWVRMILSGSKGKRKHGRKRNERVPEAETAEANREAEAATAA